MPYRHKHVFTRQLIGVGAAGAVTVIEDLIVLNGEKYIYEHIAVHLPTTANVDVMIGVLISGVRHVFYEFDNLAAGIFTEYPNRPIVVRANETLEIEFAASADAEVLTVNLQGYLIRDHDLMERSNR